MCAGSGGSRAGRVCRAYSGGVFGRGAWRRRLWFQIGRSVIAFDTKALLPSRCLRNRSLSRCALSAHSGLSSARFVLRALNLGEGHSRCMLLLFRRPAFDVPAFALPALLIGGRPAPLPRGAAFLGAMRWVDLGIDFLNQLRMCALTTGRSGNGIGPEAHERHSEVEETRTRRAHARGGKREMSSLCGRS